MGVKSSLSLEEAQALFPKYSLRELTPTTNGIIDTTYITKDYILKKYERSITQKIKEDTWRLKRLHSAGLNVSQLIAQNAEWYLYKKLQGKSPSTISYYNIQALARFIAKLHSQNLPAQEKFIESYEINEKLLTLKRSSYFYYKKLLPLKDFKEHFDSFIHGDIFKDNTVFDKEEIAIFDFIDGGLGSYAFDIAVALLSFNPNNKSSFDNLFLSTYNQHAPKKIALKTLHKYREIASLFYALLRIASRQNIARVKELL